ncbi:hypothetical protein LXT21_21390 [Myxococcus sp. K38C18041901]|uniref:hypothetical protein n=1 Tax=Myxococcus guangdongensis TaxID=2906760 RepID=UPI0020A7D59C|nr:hypothetical protein [Myxococcus guangdongensis]MCP3061339.1 hypothetical protein [Myxococcus guangdongensis]
MSTEHFKSSPSDSRPLSSRGRTWAARLALLVAAAASVATSRSAPAARVEESAPGVLRLSADAPSASVLLPVRLGVPNGSTQTVWVTMRAPLSARWTHDEGGSRAEPSITATLRFGPHALKPVTQALGVSEGTAVTFDAHSDGDVCRLQKPCEWEATLDVAIAAGSPVPGVVEVDWRMVGEVSFDETVDDEPQGLEFNVGTR